MTAGSEIDAGEDAGAPSGRRRRDASARPIPSARPPSAPSKAQEALGALASSPANLSKVRALTARTDTIETRTDSISASRDEASPRLAPR
ncbi:MAG TPA: hypothetical protein VFT72_20245 [Opitutaceae bacterium]|nr:hypothetical protein [Opitutaceae bacterium]